MLRRLDDSLVILGWFSDGASMAASPTLRQIPGGRQVPEDGVGGGLWAWGVAGTKGEIL